MARRTDGMCPRCGIRPRYVRPGGQVQSYCRECRNSQTKTWHHGPGRVTAAPAEPTCPRCQVRPRHRSAGGLLSGYCLVCLKERTRARRQTPQGKAAAVRYTQAKGIRQQATIAGLEAELEFLRGKVGPKIRAEAAAVGMEARLWALPEAPQKPQKAAKGKKAAG